MDEKTKEKLIKNINIQIDILKKKKEEIKLSLFQRLMNDSKPNHDISRKQICLFILLLAFRKENPVYIKIYPDIDIYNHALTGKNINTIFINYINHPNSKILLPQLEENSSNVSVTASNPPAASSNAKYELLNTDIAVNIEDIHSEFIKNIKNMYNEIYKTIDEITKYKINVDETRLNDDSIKDLRFFQYVVYYLDYTFKNINNIDVHETESITNVLVNEINRINTNLDPSSQNVENP